MSVDIRQIAFETELSKQALWIDRWGQWVMVQELTGEERANLLQQCTVVSKSGNKREASINLKKLYPMLAILSLHYPDPNVLPDKIDPNYAKYPGAKDDSNNYFTPPHEKAGELIFALTDLVALNQRSGTILEQISKPAALLSGLREEDIEEKKEASGEQETGNTIESTGFAIG